MLTLVTVLCAVLCCQVSSAAMTATEARDGVVYIESYWDVYIDGVYYENGIGCRGSGFAIGEKGKPVQYIITNAHVVHDTEYGLGESTDVTVFFSKAANRYMTGTVVYSDVSKDIAIIRLPEPTTERVPLTICPIDDFDIDDEVTALGYPANSDDYMEDVKYDVSDIVITRGFVSRQMLDYNKREVYLIDLKIQQGNSGGPLVNSRGEVIGINSYSVGSEDNYAICIDEILNAVRAEGIKYDLSTDVNVGLIVGIIIAVVVLAGGAVAVLIIFKKKKANGGAVPAKGGAAKNEKAPAAQYTVIGVNGALKGRSYPLVSTLVIGRDASRANIVFPTNTNGVSSVHCEVRINNGKIEVIDRKSTYGTFIGSGQRMIADLPTEIKPGEYFYLGSTDQMFQVR